MSYSRAGSKTRAPGGANLGRNRRRMILCAAAAAAICLDGALVRAAGPISVANVAAGAASFAHVGNTTVIHASNNTIINYRQFNIPAGQEVDFIQPNAASRVLNRVITDVPSQIDGTLRANGVVYLVNPAGVIFGPNSVVNVGDLYAAAGHISNANFLSGVDHFTDLSGAVANYGNINAGAVSLLGESVINTGIINAPHGTIVLASAKDVYLTRIGGLITAKLSDAAAEPQKSASAGSTAVPQANQALRQSDQLVCAGSALALGIMNCGELHAAQITAEAAGKNSSAIISGTLNASTDQTGGHGGSISIQAGHIAVGYAINGNKTLSSAATDISADGPAGGGTILIGAESDAGSPSGYVDAAQTDRISGATTIDASATASGSGGFIDTSGQELAIGTGAQIIGNGAGGGSQGVWQLDPLSVNIDGNSTSSGMTTSTKGGALTISSPTSGTGSYDVNVNTIINSLTAGTSVTVSSAGYLTLKSAIDPDFSSASKAVSLSLTGQTVDIESPIDPAGNSSTLSVALTSTAGAVTINSGIGLSGNPVEALNVQATGGAINLGANVYTSGSVGQTYDGSININGSAISLSETSTGDIILGASGAGDTMINSTTGSNSMTITSRGGYIADNASMASNTQPLSMNWSAGGQSSSGAAVAFNAPIQTDGGPLTITSTGIGGFTATGLAGTGASTPAALISTGGGNATFTSNGGSINFIGGAAGATVGGAAIDTGAGNLAINITSGTPAVVIQGGSGGTGTFSSGGAGAYVGGNFTIGSSTSPAGAVTISGGSGGTASGGIAGTGGVGLIDHTGAITINFGGASVVQSGNARGSSGAPGGNAIQTTSSNLQFNPSNSSSLTFDNNANGSPFATSGSFTFNSGGRLNLSNGIQTAAGLSLQSPVILASNVTLIDDSAAGISLAGATTSGKSLSVTENGSGNIALAGNFGTSANPLSGFTATPTGGTITLNGAAITSNGGITLGGPIALTGTDSLSDNSTPGIHLPDYISGTSSPLAITESGASSVNFGGDVTAKSLSITGNSVFGTGATTFLTSQGMTFGNITFGTGTTLTDAGTSGNGITLGTVTGGGESLTLSTSGSNINLNNDISGVANLQAQGSTILGSGVTSVATADGQNYAASLQINGSPTLSDASSAGISIAQIVSSASANLTIDESGGGNVSLPAPTSTGTKLGSLVVTGNTVFTGAGSTSATAGTIITTGGQTYNSPMQLAGQFITLQDGSTVGISVNAVNGDALSGLTLDETGPGPVNLNGIIGSTQSILSLRIPSQPTLGSLVVTASGGGPIEISTPLINVGTLSLFSNDPIAGPIANLSGTTLDMFAAQQSYTADGSGAYLNFKTDNVELFGANALTPATSIALTQSRTITDADIPVFSSAAISLDSLNGNVVLDGGSDIPQATALSVTSTGGYVTLGTVSLTNVLSLNANAKTAINIDQSVTTTDGQTYALSGTSGGINIPDSPITLSDGSSNGITLDGPMIAAGTNSALALTENGSGTVSIVRNVGTSTVPFASLTVSSPTGGIVIGNSSSSPAISTSGAQIYTGAVSLAGSTTLSAASGAVTFNNAVATGGSNLSVSASDINLIGGSVTGTGNQSYTGQVNISTATTLAGGTILLDGTLNSGGSSNLNISAAGNLTFEKGGAQFTSGGLGTLTASAAGMITLGGSLSADALSFTSTDGVAGAITASAASPIYLAANDQSYATTTSGGTVSLQDSKVYFTGYPSRLQLTSSGLAHVNSLPLKFSVSQASLLTDANLPTVGQFATVQTPIFPPGNQSITAASSLNQMPYSISYTGSPMTTSPAISLTGQDDLSGSDLSLQATGSVISLGAPNQSLTLGSLSINGIVNLAGTIVTNGTSTNSQSYTGTLVLNGGTVLLDNSGSGTVSINAQITTGTSSNLIVQDTGGGIINFLNAVGDTNNPLGSLTVNATNGSTLDISGGSVVTSGGQKYSGNLKITANTLLEDNGGSGSTGINISGPLSGSSYNLTLTESANVPMNLGASGNTFSVHQLTVQASGGLNLNGGTIQTSGGQSYTGTLNVTAPTTLADSSGSSLSLPDITGPSILTIAAPSDSVSLTTAINPAGINITGQDISLPAGNAISTSLGQTLSGPITLGGTSHSSTTLSDTGAAGSTGIQLLGSIVAPTDSLTLNQGGGISALIGTGASSTFNLQNLTIAQGDILSRLGTLVVNNPINNAGDLTLLNSLLYTNDGGTLTLAGNIDLRNGSTLTAESATGPFAADVISNATIGSISDVGNVTIDGDNVTINGSIRAAGEVQLQDNNTLMVGPFGAANGDFRPTALLTINNNISGANVLLNPDSPIVPGLGTAVPDAATIVSSTGATVNIAGGVVAMGREQKWTSLGSLNISGSTVSLGDLNVLNNLTVTAPTINMLTRSFGSLLTPQGLHTNSATKPDGVDVVAGNIHLSSMPIPLPAAAPGGPPYPQFATPTGGGTVPGYAIHVFGLNTGGLTGATLYSTVLTPGVTASQKYYLDLQASGPVTTNVSDSFTDFALPQIPQVKTTLTLSSSQRAVLRAAGINARNPSVADLLALSDGRVVFNDLPRSDGLILENPSLIDYYVTTSRLPYHRTLAFIALYRKVFLTPVRNPRTGLLVRGKNGVIEYRSLRNAIHLQFRQAWVHYKAFARKQPHARLTAAGFRNYLLHTPGEKLVAQDVRHLSALIYQAYELGLSPKALRLSAGTILAQLNPEALSSRQFERVVLGPRIGLLARRDQN
ncbi:MAG: filamentous hemagglutinin N-terminal domain-containing protein [Phycisphaerae bacterium]